MTYVGRFAPSPSGPLHLGSVVAAAASYLDAKAHHGVWLVRIEDLDQGRSDPAIAQHILDTLAALGMTPDRPPTYQSRQQHRYRDAAAALRGQGLIYPCGCTRAQIREAAQTPGVYPGTCRDGLAQGRSGRSLRLRLEQPGDAFDDRFAGPQYSQSGQDYGDPTIVRADDSFAYILAGAVDDVLDGITDVVRGDDLLPTTSPQRLLLERLELAPPRYAHIPVLLGPDGRKLSKQNHAPAIDASEPLAVLRHALDALGLRPFLGRETFPQSVNGLWRAAICAWKDYLADRQATISR